MSKEKDEKVVKEIIEYANQEISKNKKKTMTVLLSILAGLVLLVTSFYFVFAFERPVPYSEDLLSTYVPVDKGLDVKVNLPNYKSAQAVLVKVDENTYDLYVNVTQTLSTKIFKDDDESDNMLRVGNNIVVDYQSGLLRESLPSGYTAENIMHIYYVDNLSNEIMVMEDSELVKYENKVLVWTRDSID